MPQDAYTLKHLCRELNELLIGGKVNKIVQPSADKTLMYIYTGKTVKKLLIDVDPGCPRIGVTDAEYKISSDCPNFCMLLRKHLSGATVTGVSVIGFDRIVKIDFLSSPEFCDSVTKTLYVELMGRYSNTVLTENGKVLGGNRGINCFDNGVRPLIVGKPYVTPPVNGKKLPDDEGLKTDFGAYKGGDVSAYICSFVMGTAQSTAEQAISEFAVKKGITAEKVKGGFADYSEEFADFIKDFLYSDESRPCCLKSGDEIKDVFNKPYFAAKKSDKDEFVYFNTLTEAEDFYFSERTLKKEFTEKKARLNSLVNSAIKKCKKKLAAIGAKEKEAENFEENRVKGELIISNIYKIKQGDKKAVVANYYDGGKLIEIELDDRLSPSKNAESFYKKYNKQKRTLSALAPQKEAATAELDYLESFSEEIALATIGESLDVLFIEAENAGLIKSAKTKKDKSPVLSAYRVCVADGVTIKIGRSNVENDALTFSAKPNYTWFHVKDYHSSHVLAEEDVKNLSDKVIRIAAEICAYYSKARNGGKTEVVYTLKKYVKKPTGAKKGFCTYTDYKSINVVADGHFEL